MRNKSWNLKKGYYLVTERYKELAERVYRVRLDKKYECWDHIAHVEREILIYEYPIHTSIYFENSTFELVFEAAHLLRYVGEEKPDMEIVKELYGN